MTSISSVSRKEMREMFKNAIPSSQWHFEKCGGGVKPVEGKFDPSNPKHIKVSDVVRTHP